MTQHIVTEQELHRAVVLHLRQRGVPDLVFWHTPNGVKGRSRKHHVQGAIAKGLGVRAGVSDLVLLHRGHAYALELKAPNGRPTVEQMEFVSDFNSAGGHACIVEGLDRALRVLETWGLLRGQAAVAERAR
ncbi:MAG: VRR-NUC domain-containing protein [Xanthobacteraceae bacterium]